MRRFKLLLSMCAILGAMLFVACQENGTIDKVSTETSLNIEETTVEVDSKGGTISLNYTLNNGINGIDIVASSDVEWITNIKTEESVLYFDVARNTTDEAREAIVMVKYPNINSLFIKVKQAAFDSLSFELSYEAVSTTSCNTRVKASDPEAFFFVYMSEVDYLTNSRISTPEDLFADDYNYVRSIAEQYGVTKQLKDFMILNAFTYQDESYVQWNGMVPNKEYILYAYAIEFSESGDDYYLASPISYKIFTLSAGNLRETQFDVDIIVNGPKVEYNINPVDWDGKYYLDIYKEGDYMYVAEGTQPDDAYCQRVAEQWIDIINQYMGSGYSSDQLYELMCLQGPESYSEMRDASSKYVMIIYAIDMVDDFPQVVSKPQAIHFETEEVGQSDMTIDITVENNYVRVADISFTPSSDYEPYVLGLMKTSDIYGDTGTEIIHWLVDTFSLSTTTGKVVSHVNNLEPNTEYTLLAFGYYGGVVTTDLFRKDFKTDEAGVCENSVLNIEVTGPYSPTEYESIYPDALRGMGSIYEEYGYCIFAQEMTTETYCVDQFHYFYEPLEFEEKGMDEIFNELIQYTSKTLEVYTARAGVVFVSCGVTMDYRGNFSEMWVGEEPFMFEYSASTKRPIEELVTKIEAANSASAKVNSLVIHDATTKDDIFLR